MTYTFVEDCMRLPAFVSKTTALAIILTMTLSSTLAFAGKPEALKFYEQAQQAYVSKDFKKAADLLEKAFAQDPDLIYMYNRILALKAAGEPEEAMRLFKLYSDPMSKDTQKRFGEEDLNTIKSSLETAIVEKKAQADKKTDPDKKDDKKKVVKPPPPVKKKKETNILGWSLIGGGSVLLATGVLFGSGLLKPNREDFAPTEQDEFDSQVQTQQIITVVGYAGGLLLIAGGAATFFLGGDDEDPKAASVMPYVSPDGAGAAVQFRF